MKDKKTLDPLLILFLGAAHLLLALFQFFFQYVVANLLQNLRIPALIDLKHLPAMRALDFRHLFLLISQLPCRALSFHFFKQPANMPLTCFSITHYFCNSRFPVACFRRTTGDST